MMIAQTERRQHTARNWVYPRIATNLVNQIDQTISSAQEFGMPKYASRNEFVEAAIRSLLLKERKRSA